MEWPGSLSREHLARCPQPTRLSTFATVPLAPARRGNASPIESCRDLSERLRPYSLGFSNGRHDDVGVSVGASLLGGVGDDAGLGQPRIAKYLTASLGGSQGGLRALGDHCTLFLGESGIEVQQERLNVRPKIGGDERRLVRHQAADEMHVTRQSLELGDGDGGCLPVTARHSQ